MREHGVLLLSPPAYVTYGTSVDWAVRGPWDHNCRGGVVLAKKIYMRERESEEKLGAAKN